MRLFQKDEKEMSTRTLTTSTLLAAALAAASTAGAQTFLSDSASDYDTNITGVGEIRFDLDYSDFSQQFFNG